MYRTYQLQAHDTTLTHSVFKQWFVRDFDDNDYDELRAQVASGDYFITLATKLDDLSQELADIHPDGHIALEKTIADLEKLQKNYYIRQK